MIDKCLEQTTNESPDWNSSEWLKSFEESKAQKNPKKERVKVFESTVEIVTKGEYITENGNVVRLSKCRNKNTVCGSVFYDSELEQIESDRKYNTTVSDVTGDCLAFAKAQYKNDSTDDLCIITLVNEKAPGRHVVDGYNSPTEYILRCSDYYRCLFRYYASPFPEKYGIQSHPTNQYPLNPQYGGIFSRSVTIFRKEESQGYALCSKPWKINVVAMPTPIFKLRTGRLLPRVDSHGYPMMLKDTYVWINGKKTKYNEDVEREKANNALKDSIRAALRISYSNNQCRLIFVPIRRHIHNIILKVLSEPEFSDAFREIYFVYKVKEPSVNKRAAKESLLNIQNIIDEFKASSTDYNFLGEEALKKKYKNNYLSIHELMERYCDKWLLSVLFALENGCQIPMSYGAIRMKTNLSSDKMLSRALMTLEEDGMIYKDDSSLARPKYSLTERGQSLLVILHSFEKWIEDNNHFIKASRMEFYEKQKLRQKIKQKTKLQKSKKK